ncbi:hypothetical protein [Arthrobacter sp. B3I4]|uniref:hypothetical protein n=1 Tax=Arthrobacter sp. B3I4 TaxID=3042267 RepID=UPI0027851491|nr:hypothetical protein [Arthrobacter sp. B3I4]MDQ0755202.1 sugar lactone lactonase YvrE [Arthrobacter sp. B3I4]
MRNISTGTTIRRVAAALLAAAATLLPAPLATAAGPDSGHGGSVITLPGATGAEGIAAGEGSTFFAGDRLNGDIFRGDIRDGTASRFITAPSGRSAAGMKVDVCHDLLFVAGGGTGQAYIYDLDSGKTEATYQLAAPGASFINDVTLTSRGAWFTNSQAGELYFVPVARGGEPGTARTLKLTGPAAPLDQGFNLNGIASTEDGGTLIVAHTARGLLYTVDPRTGESAQIEGVSVPNVDGILLRGNTLWAVQNLNNLVSRVHLGHGLDSGAVRQVITSPHFDVPTTAALFGNTLAVVNAKFTNPAATSFEIVRVRAR